MFIPTHWVILALAFVFTSGDDCTCLEERVGLILLAGWVHVAVDVILLQKSVYQFCKHTIKLYMYTTSVFTVIN